MPRLAAAMLMFSGACTPYAYMGPSHPTPGSARAEHQPGESFYQNLGVEFAGMPIDDAKTAAFVARWYGEIDVREDATTPLCAIDTVCWFEPSDWKFTGERPALVFHVVPIPPGRQR
jgi:hypothetical protein